MKIVDSRTFRNGDQVAVTLPAELGIGAGVELEMIQSGDTVTLRKKRETKMTPQELVRRLREIGPPPGGVQKREPIEFPERPGL